MLTNPARMRFSPTSFAPSMWGIWGNFGGKFGVFLSFFQFLVEIICAINLVFSKCYEKSTKKINLISVENVKILLIEYEQNVEWHTKSIKIFRVYDFFEQLRAIIV